MIKSILSIRVNNKTNKQKNPFYHTIMWKNFIVKIKTRGLKIKSIIEHQGKQKNKGNKKSPISGDTLLTFYYPSKICVHTCAMIVCSDEYTTCVFVFSLTWVDAHLYIVMHHCAITLACNMSLKFGSKMTAPLFQPYIFSGKEKSYLGQSPEASLSWCQLELYHCICNSNMPYAMMCPTKLLLPGKEIHKSCSRPRKWKL